MQLADELAQLGVCPAAEVYLPPPWHLFHTFLICGIFITAAALGPDANTLSHWAQMLLDM